MSKIKSTHLSFPLFGLLFSFVLWICLGVLIAFVYLVFVKPVPITPGDSLTTESETTPFFNIHKDVRYYKSQTFRRHSETFAKQLFASTTDEIEISTSDLNGWAKSQFDTQLVGESSQSGGKPYIAFNPGVPGFQIATSQLHVFYPITVEFFDQKLVLIVLSSGVFVSENYTPKWKMDTLYLNSAPIPFKQFLYRLIQPRLMRMLSRNEEIEKLQSTWSIIKEIEIKNATMIVRRK
jgi:hypothetical protein